MRARILAFTFLMLLAACSRLTQENFNKVQTGMTEQEVAAILGSPTESSSSTLLGISGTSSKWVSGDTMVAIRFVGGKVLAKDFEKKK